MLCKIVTNEVNKLEDLGRKVSFFRKEKGLSISKLAENLCDESTIYRLGRGKQLPRLEILNDICLKLEIPFKALFPLNEEVENLKKLCRELTYIEDYLALELAIEKCEEVLVELHSPYFKREFGKYIQWHRAILLHKKENKNLEALEILNNLVTLKNCGSELDFSIMNSTALIYLSMKDIDSAHKIYKVIYPKIKRQKTVEDLTLNPRVGYNYAYSMYQLNEYEAALKIALDVLFYLETHHLMYTLGEVYHMIGILSKKNGYLKEAEEGFKNAILLFSFTKDKINVARAEKDLTSLHKSMSLLS